MNNKWQKVWPDEEGFYWCYGYLYSGEKTTELGILKVIKIANGNAYVLNGSFYHKSEAGNVMFLRIDPPQIIPYIAPGD